MTLEEKRARIIAYHNERKKREPYHGCCLIDDDECPLFRCNGSCFEDDDLVDRNYKILFGEDPEDSDEERTCPTCRYWDCQYDNTECVGCKYKTLPSDPGYDTAPIKWTPAASDSVNDPVNHPSHYTSGGIECIDAIAASMTPIEYAGFLKGQVLKYVWRYRLKGKPVEDLKKTRFYLDRLIQLLENEEVNA